MDKYMFLRKCINYRSLFWKSLEKKLLNNRSKKGLLLFWFPKNAQKWVDIWYLIHDAWCGRSISCEIKCKEATIFLLKNSLRQLCWNHHEAVIVYWFHLIYFGHRNKGLPDAKIHFGRENLFESVFIYKNLGFAQ